MPDFDKQTIADEFKKPNNISKEDIQSLYRILIITDAYGMNINNPDIINIWQFDFLDSLPITWQRLDRNKKRNPGVGRFILIYPLKLKGMSETH